METGIHGVPRAREWDAVVTVEAEGVEGEHARFVALPGVLVVEEGEHVEPLANAVDQVAAVPYRAEADAARRVAVGGGHPRARRRRVARRSRRRRDHADGQ